MMQSSSQDVPGAHEICLTRKVDHEGNIAAVQHPSTGEWWFVMTHVQLFGRSDAVCSFSRFSRFHGAAVIKPLATLCAMSYNDGNIRNLAQVEGAGQQAIGTFLGLCGMGLKDDKR